MMTSVFLHFLNLSITAGWMVLAVLLLRLCLKKAPRWITCVLWSLVALRLIMPFSIESPVSLIPSAQTVVSGETGDASAPTVNSGVQTIDKPLNDWLQAPLPDAPDTAPDGTAEVKTVSRMEHILQIAAPVWLIGIGIMLIYELLSVLRVRSRVLDAVRLSDNVWQSDRVASPFIFGLFRPRIYIPYGLEECVLEQVLAHERAHLQRRDHWVKPFAFTLLAVYWYNPLLWIGYILLCRDIEVACDQRVVRRLGEDERRRYATTLLRCSVERRSIAACPLAFGEVSIKQRIQSVLNYRKPLLWVIIASLVICAVAAVCLLTVPKGDVVHNTQEITPNQYYKFYGTDTDGSITENGPDWLWAHAANPDDHKGETDIPLVLCDSKAAFDELVTALDDPIQYGMYNWFELDTYDETFFEDKAAVWLFVPGYNLGNYSCTVALEETDNGLRYAATLKYESTSTLAPMPDRCQYLMLFEVEREKIEQAGDLSTRHERAPVEVPPQAENMPSYALGDADLDGDGDAESIRVFYAPETMVDAFVIAYKTDGTPILCESIHYQYFSQCYLVPQEDGSSLLLFIEADDSPYHSESFGVLSLKDDVRTVLDDNYGGRMDNGYGRMDFSNLIPYYQSLSDYMKNARLLCEFENDTLYYADRLGDTPRYKPLGWLDGYRESDNDNLQDILENIIADTGGENVPLGKIDFNDDGQSDSLFALRYTWNGSFYTCLLVRTTDGTILSGVPVYSYYEGIDKTVFLYRVTDSAGNERLQRVTLPEEGNGYVDNLTMQGVENYLSTNINDIHNYVQESGAELIGYMRGKELYLPD